MAKSSVSRRRGLLGDSRAGQVSRAARGLAAALVVLFMLLAWFWGVPSSGQFGYSEAMVQFAMVAVYAVGALVSIRWLATGATLMAVAAVAVGALSAVQFPPSIGLLVAMVLFAPALLLWLVWQQGHGSAAVLGLAVGLSVLLAAGWVASDQIFTYFYGPKAPVSATKTLSVDHVEWLWSGGLTPRSAVVVARLEQDTAQVSLQVASNSDTGAGIGVEVSTPESDDHVRRFDVTGLRPDTEYEFAVTVDGDVDRSRGTGGLTTPAAGPESFEFTFASCARLDSNAATYDAISGADPLFHIVTGDFFYGDIARDDVALFGSAYERQLTPGAPAALFRETPVAYTWDDHDFGPNDADRLSPSRDAAWTAYRSYVPHYPLDQRAESGPIFQAFTVGRARFVLADLRSERDPYQEADGPDKSMLGAEQRRWLEQELLRSSRRYAVVFWVSSVPWIVDPQGAGDSWGAYADERAALSTFIERNRLDNIVMLAGDAHMLAADDGSHSNYSGLPGRGFPVLQAGPVDQATSVKGGPYSEGVVAEPGQFGWVRVEDDGTQVTVTFEGRDSSGAPVLTYRWVAPADPG